MTFHEDIGQIRRKAGSPPHNVLSDGHIAQIHLETLDEAVTELNLTSMSWYAPRFIVSTFPDEELVPITMVGDFGRPMMVLTMDESDPNHNARSIEIVDEPQLVKYYRGGDRGPDGVKWSAEAVSFIWQQGQIYIRFAPKPRMQADYQVVYEPDRVRPQALQDQSFRLPQFKGYLTDRSAFKILPFAGLDEVAYMRIKEMLMAEIARGDLRFRQYKSSDRQQNTFRSVPFGYSRWGRRRLF